MSMFNIINNDQKLKQSSDLNFTLCLSVLTTENDFANSLDPDQAPRIGFFCF